MIKISQEPMRRIHLESVIISAFNRYFEGGTAGEEEGKFERSLMDAQARYFQDKARVVPVFQK